MKTNSELQQDVQNAIKWEPSVQAAEIGVTAKDGIVTLSGTVNSYSKKINVENAAKRVRGVKALAEDIAVNYDNNFKKNDTEIAKDLLNSWKDNWEVPDNSIQVKVEDGWVKLEGEVSWKFQEEAIIDSIKNLTGVKGVSNLIKIKLNSNDILERHQVEKALTRNWSINSRDIKVEVKDNNLKLTGFVSSIYQKDEAGHLAWNTPGVASADNELTILD